MLCALIESRSGKIKIWPETSTWDDEMNEWMDDIVVISIFKLVKEFLLIESSSSFPINKTLFLIRIDDEWKSLRFQLNFLDFCFKLTSREHKNHLKSPLTGFCCWFFFLSFFSSLNKVLLITRKCLEKLNHSRLFV